MFSFVEEITVSQACADETSFCVLVCWLLTQHTNTPPTDRHNAHIFTVVFSISVLVSVVIVGQCPCLVLVS